MSGPLIPNSYLPWDPESAGGDWDRLLSKLAYRSTAEGLIISGFVPLTIALHMGFDRVTYESHLLDSGYMYWFREDHARALGQVLVKPMPYFGLVMSTTDGDALSELSTAMPASTRIDELLLKHTTADEVSAVEARGLARWATKARVKTLHLWAGEYDGDALDALSEELLRLDNASLCELDVCLTTLPEPEDRQILPAIDSLLERNHRSS